jgi:plastocyanin
MKWVTCAIVGIVCWATPALAADFGVIQHGLVFNIKALAVHVGDRLNFHNADDVTHNITVRGSGDDADDLGLQKAGTDVNYRFDTRGTYMVVCSIHPRMKLIVTVE